MSAAFKHPSHTNPFWYEYADLARLARHLLAQRESGYPKLVYDGKITQEAATAAIHNMAGAAQLMHAMIGYSQIGTLPALRRHMHTDIAAAAIRARKMATDLPKSEAHQDTAFGLEAITYWLEPWDGENRYADISRAQHIHGLNLALRAQADAERTKVA